MIKLKVQTRGRYRKNVAKPRGPREEITAYPTFDDNSIILYARLGRFRATAS